MSTSFEFIFFFPDGLSGHLRQIKLVVFRPHIHFLGLQKNLKHRYFFLFFFSVCCRSLIKWPHWSTRICKSLIRCGTKKLVVYLHVMELLKVTQHKWDRKLLEMAKLWPIRETMAKIRVKSRATSSFCRAVSFLSDDTLAIFSRHDGICVIWRQFLERPGNFSGPKSTSDTMIRLPWKAVLLLICFIYETRQNNKFQSLKQGLSEDEKGSMSPGKFWAVRETGPSCSILSRLIPSPSRKI